MIKSFIKIIVMLLLMQYMTSCKESVTGGNIISSFQGVSSHAVLSPTAIKLDWPQQDKYKEYQVFELGQPEPLEISIFDTYTVEGLTPNTEYIFKVIAIDKADQSFGGENEIRVKTMPNFTGITAIERDLDDNIVISWDFPHNVYRYHIYKYAFSKPSAANTNNWADAHISITSNAQSYTFTDLAGSTQYYFQVHVEYRPGEFARIDQEITESTPTSFPTPLFNLPEVTIGSLPFAQISPIVNADFLNENYTSQFFHGASALSDPLVGAGVVSFLDSANLGLGEVDNITLKVNYDDDTLDETYVESGLSTYIKGKSPVIDQPVSAEGFAKGTGKLGSSMASGDFNCDGFKDLAVGMPKASLGSLGVSVNNAGAIYVYYSVTNAGVTTLNTSVEPKVESDIPPDRKGKDPQIITFSDSKSDQDFGYSMSSGGNFNGDSLGGNPCEDLIVGSPRMRTGPNDQLITGSAFVFFGNKNGLASSQTYSNIQDNIGTCNGVLEDSSCSAVRLWPDYNKWPSSAFSGGYENIYGVGSSGTGWEHSQIRFGHSVNFVGDFNADGYDDIAIGAPEADWDGEVLPGAPEDKAYLQNVGYVMIYFGSKYGLGYDTVDSTYGSAQFPFVKIFPPIPHEGMKFGSSISNGADVNGNHKIFGSDSKYHGGSDFVVGAPGFYYPNPSSLPTAYDAVTPQDGGWTNNYSSSTSYYGFSQNNPDVKTGAAFLYFGRDFSGSSKTTTQELPSRSDFWGCGPRGGASREEHYSCLSGSDDFRILFPRNNNSSDFGSAVAILGSPSYYDDVDVLQDTAIDPNADGYGDIIVAASLGEPSGKSNTGVLWQFFGNNQKYYEHNFAGQSATSAAAEFMTGSATCADFSSNTLDDVNNKVNCRPTLIQSNSFQSDARMGYSNETITIGQITGDELLDLVIGAPYDSANGSNAGAVLVFTSDTDRGLTSNYKKLYSTNGADDTELGFAVAVGNFDGDKYSSEGHYNDVAAGGPGDDSFRAGAGSGHLFLTNGFHIPSFKSDSDIQVYDDLASPQILGYQRTHIVGDVNGDGFDDAAGHTIRYSNTGAQIYDAVVYFGSKDHGLVTTNTCLENPSDYVTDGSALHCYPSANRDLSVVKAGITLPQLVPKYESQHHLWANYARPAGDVNGDGFADILFFDTSTDARYELYYGSSSGLISTDRPQWIPSSGNPQIVTENFLQTYNYGTHSGSVISKTTDNRDIIKTGDFNNDGFSDIVIFDAFAASEIMPGGWLCTQPVPDPGDTKTIEECKDPVTNNGRSIENHGLAVVFYGSSLGLQTPSMDTANFSYGQDVDLSNSATFIDIYGTEGGTAPCNSSNKCKVTLIRNPVFDNIEYGFERLGHYFGASSAIFDSGGDSFDDLFVGAYGFEDISCYANSDQDSTPLNYGRIYIFKGSSAGLVASVKTDYYDNDDTAGCPSADAGTDMALNSGTVRALQPSRYEDASTTVSERKGRQFAYSMTEAGDLNGDGFEDLAVGAPFEDINGDINSGAVYVFYGPICNTDNNPIYSSIAQDTSNLNKQITVGDVNGSVTFDPSCQVSGGKLPWQKFYVKGKNSIFDQYSGVTLKGSRKGESDINGDGFDDLIVGSPLWDDDFNGIANIGRGIVYFGSNNGVYTEDFPSVNVIANDQGQLRPYSLDSPLNQATSYFFANIISMGDYNNDGTADLMVPSYWHDGIGTNKGINIGVFFTFY